MFDRRSCEECRCACGRIRKVPLQSRQQRKHRSRKSNNNEPKWPKWYLRLNGTIESLHRRIESNRNLFTDQRRRRRNDREIIRRAQNNLNIPSIPTNLEQIEFWRDVFPRLCILVRFVGQIPDTTSSNLFATERVNNNTQWCHRKEYDETDFASDAENDWTYERMSRDFARFSHWCVSLVWSYLERCPDDEETLSYIKAAYETAMLQGHVFLAAPLSCFVHLETVQSLSEMALVRLKRLLDKSSFGQIFESTVVYTLIASVHFAHAIRGLRPLDLWPDNRCPWYIVRNVAFALSHYRRFVLDEEGAVSRKPEQLRTFVETTTSILRPFSHGEMLMCTNDSGDASTSTSTKCDEIFKLARYLKLVSFRNDNGREMSTSGGCVDETVFNGGTRGLVSLVNPRLSDNLIRKRSSFCLTTQRQRVRFNDSENQRLLDLKCYYCNISASRHDEDLFDLYNTNTDEHYTEYYSENHDYNDDVNEFPRQRNIGRSAAAVPVDDNEVTISAADSSIRIGQFNDFEFSICGVREIGRVRFLDAEEKGVLLHREHLNILVLFGSHHPHRDELLLHQLHGMSAFPRRWLSRATHMSAIRTIFESYTSRLISN